MYQMSHHYMFGGYRAKILSIAASVAVMLDGESLKDIPKHKDENTPAYLRPRGKRVRISIWINSGPAWRGISALPAE